MRCASTNATLCRNATRAVSPPCLKRARLLCFGQPIGVVTGGSLIGGGVTGGISTGSGTSTGYGSVIGGGPGTGAGAGGVCGSGFGVMCIASGTRMTSRDWEQRSVFMAMSKMKGHEAPSVSNLVAVAIFCRVLRRILHVFGDVADSRANLAADLLRETLGL